MLLEGLEGRLPSELQMGGEVYLQRLAPLNGRLGSF